MKKNLLILLALVCFICCSKEEDQLTEKEHEQQEEQLPDRKLIVGIWQQVSNYDNVLLGVKLEYTDEGRYYKKVYEEKKDIWRTTENYYYYLEGEKIFLGSMEYTMYSLEKDTLKTFLRSSSNPQSAIQYLKKYTRIK